MNDGEFFLRTDEQQQAIISLELTNILLWKIQENSIYWTWAINCLHNTLQCFMVLSLTGTNSLKVLRRNDAKDWLTAYDQGESCSKEPKLEMFLELYKKIKSEEIIIYGISKRFIPNCTQDRNIEKINELRNNLTHFIPMNLSIA